MASTDDTTADSLSDLPPSALLIYRVLDDIGPATLQELADESLLSPRTTRYALNRLDEVELIDRGRSTEDARTVIYWLAVER